MRTPSMSLLRYAACLLTLSVTLSTPVPVLAQDRRIDFRYSPASYFAAICLPDDWQKSVVTERGSLAFDFGPGPYAQPLTDVSLGLKGKQVEIVRKGFRDPRIPVFEAMFSSGPDSVQETLFAVALGQAEEPSNTFLGGKLRRLEGLVGTADWASPTNEVDPAFRTVAWGVNRPVRYQVAVPPGSTRLIALGVCDPYKLKAGLRPLVARVEGAAPSNIDPLASGQKNHPEVLLLRGKDSDEDGWLRVEMHASASGPDPNTILSGLWVFRGDTTVSPEDVVNGKATPKAELYWNCGTELDRQPISPRVEAFLGKFTGDTLVPTVTVHSRRTLNYDEHRRLLTFQGHPFLVTDPVPEAATAVPDGWVLELPRGTRSAGVVVIHGRGGEITADPGWIGRALDRTKRFWNSASGVPRRSIFLPDKALQYFFDVSVRNLYQIRERVDGVRQFQPGPSVYRGLWVHDAVYQIEAALMLGDTAGAREALEGIMSRQLASGQVKVSSPYPMHRETACTAFMMCRYAEYADNSRWLLQHWQKLRAGLDWLWKLRESTLGDSGASYRGLFPPGFADGGITGLEAEYGTPIWTLIALKTGVEAAEWVGKLDDARRWRARYDELLRSFVNASRRDMRKDDFGNWYLPLNVADTMSSRPPAQAAWGMVEAIGTGMIFSATDSLALGTLKMLRDHTAEGLTLNSGYLRGGVWPWFDAMRGMAHLAMRQYGHAADILYACANHACPYGTWVEEQLPKASGAKTTGDGSNATGSSLLIEFVRRFLIYEREGSVELLSGAPTEWFRAGSHVEVADLPTRYGRISLRLDVASDRSQATLHVSSKARSGARCVLLLSTQSLSGAGFAKLNGRPVPKAVRLQWGETKDLRITP